MSAFVKLDFVESFWIINIQLYGHSSVLFSNKHIDLHKNTIANIHITTNDNTVPINAGTGTDIPKIMQ